MGRHNIIQPKQKTKINYSTRIWTRNKKQLLQFYVQRLDDIRIDLQRTLGGDLTFRIIHSTPVLSLKK